MFSQGAQGKAFTLLIGKVLNSKQFWALLIYNQDWSKNNISVMFPYSKIEWKIFNLNPDFYMRQNFKPKKYRLRQFKKNAFVNTILLL